jgi:NAD(P)-dependent dehydrogenase (short-subunit alcohol dehydrogenase family)
MPELLGLSGRTAIVTGAASGYGQASAQLLAKCGLRVAACDIDGTALSRAAAELWLPEKHLAITADIGNVPTCEGLIGKVLDAFGRLDILVNAAAVLKAATIETVDEELWDQTLDVNLKGPYFLARAASRPMRAAKWGRVINFVSTAGVTGGTSGVSVYGISKAGIINMTRSLARAFGRDNVLVNAISPASLRTPLFRRGRTDAELAQVSDDYERASLFGRWTEPEEVARSVLYLCSQMSSCVTGQILHADAGAGVVHP